MPTPEPDPESQRQPSQHRYLLAACQQYTHQYLRIAESFIDGVHLLAERTYYFLPRMGIYRSVLSKHSGSNSFFLIMHCRLRS